LLDDSRQIAIGAQRSHAQLGLQAAEDAGRFTTVSVWGSLMHSSSP
jgi:hypothetical protein